MGAKEGAIQRETIKTLVPILFVLSVPATVFFFPAAFSAIIGHAFYVAFGFLALIVVLVAVFWIWKRLFPASFSKTGITIAQPQSTGYVGSPGVGSRLRIKESDTGIHVEWARLDYAVVLVVLCLFGPGIILLYVRSPQKFNHDLPPLAMVVIGAFVLFISGLFVRWLWIFLWKRPSLQVGGGNIEFLAGKKSIRTLAANQIHSLAIRDYTYRDDRGRSVPNYILAGQTDSGDEPLCISDSRLQIEQLMQDIALRIGVNLQHSPQASDTPGSPATVMTAALKAEVKSLKQAGAVIDAIQLVRDHSDMDLREAKRYVELL